jgi:hypothetical protein
MPRPDHYEPLPGFTDLPGWLWRRTGPGVRIAVGVLLLAAIAAAAALGPQIGESKRERAQSEEAERAERRAQLIRELRAEQRPRFRRSDSVAPPGAGHGQRLAARAALMDELPAAILTDARGRARRGELDGPVRGVECEPFPRSVDGSGAEKDLSERRGGYSCIAVTAEFGQSGATVAGVIGHRYRALVDFETGRYAFCKVSGQAGPSREQLVTTPEACGGR